MNSEPINDCLSNILFGKTRHNILAVFYGHSDETFYLRQLTRIVSGGMGAVQREVKAFTKAGIIRRVSTGRQNYYQANSQCPVFSELKSIVIKTSGMGDVLKIALAPLAENIRVAFIFGSIARGEENKKSDVDVLVIGDVTFDEVIKEITPVQQMLNREINASVYPVMEFKNKLAKGHHFIKTVYKEKKLFLIGNENDLAKLVA